MKELLLKFWIWFGTKIIGFEIIDIYSPNEKDVVAIIFSHSESYIDKIQKIEI